MWNSTVRPTRTHLLVRSDRTFGPGPGHRLVRIPTCVRSTGSSTSLGWSDNVRRARDPSCGVQAHSGWLVNRYLSFSGVEPDGDTKRYPSGECRWWYESTHSVAPHLGGVVQVTYSCNRCGCTFAIVCLQLQRPLHVVCPIGCGSTWIREGK